MKKSLIVLIFLCQNLIWSQQTYIHCGQLFDAQKAKFLGPHTIVVNGETIVSVSQGFQNPSSSEATVIDLKTKTVYPGFIDLHVHIEGEYTPTQ